MLQGNTLTVLKFDRINLLHFSQKKGISVVHRKN